MTEPGSVPGLTAAGGRLRAVPILHGRFEFAVEVRRAFAAHRPTQIAVELPGGLARPFREAVRRLPLLSVLEVEEAVGGAVPPDGTTPSGARERPGSRAPIHLLVEPTDGLTEAVRLGLEHDVEVIFADRDASRVTPVRQPLPDPHALETLGLETYAGLSTAVMPAFSGEETHRHRTMAHHLTGLLADESSRVLFVGALPTARPVLARVGQETAVPFGRRPRLTARVWHLHPEASREVLTEMPYLAGLYEEWRAGRLGLPVQGDWPLPRRQVHLALMAQARKRLRREEGEEIAPPSVANLFRYARNCALLEGGLIPDFYNLVLAARGFGDDNFAWHVWEIGSTYPHREARDRRPALRITLEDLDRSGRLVRFERKIRRRRPVLRLVRRRPAQARRGEWKEQWAGVSLCSYPPEDVVIEGYGRALAHKAKGILAADRSRVEPFTSSLLDGIDFRETIRNRAHDGRIYVRRNESLRGQVGAVVVAFDAEDRENRYGYRMTWQGEHDQESDMALYSTPPGEQVTGPGISRCEYGGFLLTWPPGRMFLVWEDPEFHIARTPAEHLLLAGIDYSNERMVVYVAASPPRSFVRQYATRRDRRVIYIPIGQLSPATLKKLRVFHVLDGRQVRAYARDYIW
jgi:hypothetical protein